MEASSGPDLSSLRLETLAENTRMDGWALELYIKAWR